MVVLLTTTTPFAAAPRRTVAPGLKLAPVICTAGPPMIEPAPGEIAVTSAAGPVTGKVGPGPGEEVGPRGPQLSVPISARRPATTVHGKNRRNISALTFGE